ncbi:hypothetical protein L7F22_008093 [Adiantum nelumboides]|nr:hypothetical protein [Adiantum nelumboides]
MFSLQTLHKGVCRDSGSFTRSDQERSSICMGNYSDYGLSKAERKKLMIDSSLKLLDLQRPFEVHCDACGSSLGVVLQHDGQVIAYESRLFTEGEKIAQIYEKELLAVIHALSSWKHYLLGGDFTVHTDHQKPPKALDEDETEFLEILDKFKKEQELLVANEEAQQLLAFQLAVANRTTMVRELTSSLHNTEVEPLPQKERKPDPVKAILSSIRVKPQPKKAKIDNPLSSERVLQSVKKDLEATKSEQKTEAPRVTSLVSYGTDSEDDQ